MPHKSQKHPVVLACAGCSSAGRLAYDLALELDRRGHAEMSCLAGVGAKRKVFLRKLEDRPIWIIDGCPIECSRGVMEQVDREADVHIKLHDYGVAKKAAPAAGVSMNALVVRVLTEARHAQCIKPTDPVGT